MIDLSRLDPKLLSTEPYEWAFIDSVFELKDAAALARAGSPAEHLGWGARLYAAGRSAGFNYFLSFPTTLLSRFSYRFRYWLMLYFFRSPAAYSFLFSFD